MSSSVESKPLQPARLRAANSDGAGRCGGIEGPRSVSKVTVARAEEEGEKMLPVAATASSSSATAAAPAAAANSFDILLCYLYTPVGEPPVVAELAQWFTRLCNRHGAIGRVLVSTEGINVNIACASDGGGIDAVCEEMRHHVLLGGNEARDNDIDFKVERQATDWPPFPDLKVTVVKEIVPTAGDMPAELLDTAGGGTHLSPEDFHRVLTEYRQHGQAVQGQEHSGGGAGDAVPDKQLVVIDVRNRKEIEFGHFRGALSSDTKMFSEWAVRTCVCMGQSMRGRG